jgi:polyisoprenyl-phosphate glycosyltransferase
VRAERHADSVAKRLSAKMFYQVMRRFVLPELPEDSGDFKAFTRPVLEALRTYRERVRFMRGMIATIGFTQAEVRYVRAARVAGRTKFSVWRMARFARDAIVSNTVLPLRAGVFAGGIALIACVTCAAVWCLEWGSGRLEEPLLHLAVLLLLGLGGFALMLLGIAGEYLRCIIMEIKQRPLYIVASTRNVAAKQGEGARIHAESAEIR